MAKISAGLLMYRFQNKTPEVFLAHPGGPFYTNKDNGVWGIPKGEQEDGESLLDTAKREFSEETGITLKPDSVYLELGPIKQSGGKQVYAWAFEDGEYDPQKMISNTFPLEWPPHSGKIQQFPENDRGDYFSPDEATLKILPAQKPFLDRLREKL